MEKTEFDAEKIWKVIEGSRQHAVKKKLPSSRPNLLTLLNNSLVEWIEKCSNKCARKSGGLLEGLVSTGLQVSIIVNLYSDAEGYSIMLPLSPGEQGDQKEVALPYEDVELLNYIEANEIPPVVLELLATSSTAHFYSGCVVAEVRNFRGFFPSPSHCERTYLLLHPTQETLLSTVEQARRQHQLTYEQVLAVEGHLLRTTTPQLCLDPTSDVLCVANRLQYGRNKFRTYSMRRYLRKQLPGYRRSRRALSRLSAPEPLRLHDFVTRLDQKRASPLDVGVSRAPGSGTTVCDLHGLELTVPGSLEKFSIDFAKYLVIDQPAGAPESPLPAIQSPVSFSGAPMEVSQNDEEQYSVFLNYPRTTPSPVIVVPPTEAPPTPAIQPPIHPLHPAVPAVPMTHPLHPIVPALPPTRPLHPTVPATPMTHPTVPAAPVARPLHPTVSAAPVTHPLHPTVPATAMTHPLHPTVPAAPMTRPLPPTVPAAPMTHPTVPAAPVTRPLHPTIPAVPVTRPLPPTVPAAPMTHPTVPAAPVTRPLHPTIPAVPVTRPLHPTVPAAPVTRPLPPTIQAVLPSSTAPPPIVQPSPRPPAPPTPPQVAAHQNLMMLNLLNQVYKLRPYQQPPSSRTTLTVAPPTPTTPATVVGPVQLAQVTATSISSTHPMGKPILPPSAHLQNKSYTTGGGRICVTARVVEPTSQQPVLARPSRPPQIVKPTEGVLKPSLVAAHPHKPVLIKPEIVSVGQMAHTLRSQVPPVLRTAPPPLRSNSPTLQLQRPPPTASPRHPKLHPASTAQIPPQLHRAMQQVGFSQTMLLTPPRLQGPTLTTPTLGEARQQLPLKDRIPHSSVPPVIVRPSLASGASSSHTAFASTAPPQLGRATWLPTAPPPLRGAPRSDTHMPPVGSAPPPLRGVPRSDTHTPPVGSAPPPLRGVPRMDTHTPPLVSAPPPLRGAVADKHTPPILLHREGKKPTHGQDKQ